MRVERDSSDYYEMHKNPSTCTQPVGESVAQTEILVGRQAIFDRRDRVVAYELLYRDRKGGPQGEATGEQASSRVMLYTFLDLGVERIVGPHQAFVNFTDDLIVNLPAVPFEPNRLVLEILEDAEVDDRLLRAVTDLSARGYMIALDDYALESKWDPLLPQVNIIKFDVSSIAEDGLGGRIEPLRARGTRLLAEKVETEAQYRFYRELGFDLFQGYYFYRPQIVKGRRLTENQLTVMQLLARINDPLVEIGELTQLIAQDASLSYKVLRYINSAALNLPRRVDSINQALVYLGLDRIRGLASLMALTGVNNKPVELLISALVRAQLCQYLARTEVADVSSCYTVGLLSILDQLLDMSMQDVLKELPLSERVKDALLHHRGIEGEALSCALAYEQHRWDEVAFRGLQTEEICKYYLQSTELAFQAETVIGAS